MKARKYSAALLFLGLISGQTLASHWSYEGEGSPEHWSELSPENQQCKTGMNQSPIDISHALAAHVAPLISHYPDSPESILNNGHTIQATMSAKSDDTITIDGNVFKLQQFHFHSPSENTLNGKHAAMELHLVHKNAEGELAVVAVMFNTGAANDELTRLWQAMPSKAESQQPLMQQIDVSKLLPLDKTYYRFSGSLTTPPCSEGVRWVVMKHPLTLSVEQLKQFTDVMHHDNNRPVQPLHGRVIVE
jgi:carbonic anhydrase